MERAELAAVCSTSPGKLKEWKAGEVKVFGEAEELFRSGAVDAVLLATPHFQHADLGIAAFGHGLHVLCEKPIAAHKADAERLIAAHEKYPKLVFACMYQFRAEARFPKIRELVKDVHAGNLQIDWSPGAVRLPTFNCRLWSPAARMSVACGWSKTEFRFGICLFTQFTRADFVGSEFLKRIEQRLDGGGLRGIGNGPDQNPRAVCAGGGDFSAPAGKTWTPVTAVGRRLGSSGAGPA